MGRLVIDQHFAVSDELLHVQARTQAGLGQHFVQFGGVGLGAEYAFDRLGGGRGRGLIVVGAGDDVIKLNAGFAQWVLPVSVSSCVMRSGCSGDEAASAPVGGSVVSGVSVCEPASEVSCASSVMLI